MPPELVAWLVIGFVALVVLHEAAHVLVARWHGHPCVCVAINPVGVAVVFEDTPRLRYWSLQVIVPAAISWGVCYVWLYGLFTYPAPIQSRAQELELLENLPLLVTLLTLLTSGGDILSGFMEVRRPIHGDERIRRDFAILRKMPTLVLFTTHGRQRWQAVWHAIRAGTTSA
ncbi:MAG: site-2 protease family protein [Chloroflexi bacterium]|nr:site-2 protease family protein [Chloroflexota bacterium]